MQTAGSLFPLTGLQLQVARALLSGHSVAAAALTCGVPERTIRHWKRQPAFRGALLEGQAQHLDETRMLLAGAASEAVKALVQVCQDPCEKSSLRIAAASKLLTLLFRHVPEVAGVQFLETAVQPAEVRQASTGEAADRSVEAPPLAEKVAAPVTEPAADGLAAPAPAGAGFLAAPGEPEPAAVALPAVVPPSSPFSLSEDPLAALGFIRPGEVTDRILDRALPPEPCLPRRNGVPQPARGSERELVGSR